MRYITRSRAETARGRDYSQGVKIVPKNVSGAAQIVALQSFPILGIDIDIDPARYRLPVRDVAGQLAADPRSPAQTPSLGPDYAVAASVQDIQQTRTSDPS